MASGQNSWKELTEMTRGEQLQIERVRVKRTGIILEGEFELPALAQLTESDQVFIAAFLRSHGSIKEMERLFGISYPTVKSRLARIAELLPFVEVMEAPSVEPVLGRKEILDQLARGKIDATQAAQLLREQSSGGNGE